MDEYEEEEILLMVWLRWRRKYKKRRVHKHWLHPIYKERQTRGAYYTTFQELKKHPRKFQNYCRMSYGLFSDLLTILEDNISKNDTNFRRAIPAEERLLITLR